MRPIAPKSTANLAVGKGETVTPQKFNDLRKAVEERRNLLPGAGVRERVFPWGTIRSFDGSVGAFSPTIWAANIYRNGDKYQLTLGRGLVNGVEPVLSAAGADVPISGNADGVIPRLDFTKADFDANGQALLYLKVDLDGGDGSGGEWLLKRISPVVLPAPAGAPWTAYKLLGFLLLRGGAVRYRQMCFFNLGLGTLYDRKASGIARFVWWGAI